MTAAGAAASTAELRARLQRYLARAWPEREGLEVGTPANITSGWESDIYAFDVTWAGAGGAGREALVLRLHHGEAAGRKTRHEHDCLRRLAAAGYPVPRAALAEPESGPLGRPFLVLERIDGPVMWDVLNQAPAETAAALIDTFGALFVRLHRLDWRPFAPGQASRAADGGRDRQRVDPYWAVDEKLRQGQAAAAAYAHLGLGPVVDWLGARRDSVPCPAPAVVHQDFHPANILLRGGTEPVVIDWTNLDVSDPRIDLAWSLLLAHMYAGRAVRDQFLAAYERHAGQPVQALAWFEVYACARRLVDLAVSLSAGAEARGMRAGAAEAMRQHMGAARAAYALLGEHTGLRLVAIEDVLSQAG